MGSSMLKFLHNTHEVLGSILQNFKKNGHGLFISIFLLIQMHVFQGLLFCLPHQGRKRFKEVKEQLKATKQVSMNGCEV